MINEKKRFKWYNTYAVKYELVKAMKNKEVVFIDRLDNANTIRGLCIRSVNFLDYVFEKFNFHNRDYNIYLSVANYKYIPEFTYNLKKRSSETSKWFEKQSISEIYGYEIFNDFDGNKFNRLKKEVSTLCNILESNNIKFYYFPSGNNFQVIVPIELNETLSNEKKIDIFKKTKEFIKSIKNRFKLDYLDLKGIGTHNKVRKCPYSLVDNKVVLPLKHWNLNSSEIINSFNYDEIEVSRVLKNINIFNRGLCYVNENITLKENSINLSKMAKKYFLE